MTFRLFAEFFSYLRDRVSDSSDSTGFLIGNLDAEYFFEFHQKFNRVKGICAKIIGEICGFGDFRLFNAKLVNDNSFDLLYDFFVCRDKIDLVYNFNIRTSTYSLQSK